MLHVDGTDVNISLNCMFFNLKDAIIFKTNRQKDMEILNGGKFAIMFIINLMAFVFVKI